MTIQPTDEDLSTIAEQVWSSYLDPEEVSPLLPFPAPVRTTEVSASVSVTGSWRGHVVLSCSVRAAKSAAGALLGVELEEVTTEDIADALGELANIIGGNVKSLLPEPCALSLPHVLVGRVEKEHWPAVTEICRLDGSWQDEMVQICVLESVEDKDAGEASPS
ncbi:MAG: chemotaxis protein CheX [Dactylosporangium sp.]|nr:chemotaxis protein CheX [Dactylosporangium sp.]NNJ60983.1 chemotaxis protein CheX [Dactylosporangium sp.]